MNFGFFWSKNCRFVTHICFPKKRPWNPYFYSVFLVRVFWAKVSKKGNFEKPPPKKNWLITEKLIFGYFCSFFWLLFFLVFLFFLLFSLFFFCFCVFFGGFKGQVRWPEGPPHLALNPPSFFFFCFFGCFFCFLFFFGGLRVRWGGPKGHLTWPLTLLICFCCFFILIFVFGYLFCFFGCSIQKNLVFP